MMVNTIFKAQFVECKVDWSVVIRDVVLKLISGIEKLEPTLVYPYIFYLYHSLDTLRGDRIVAYKTTKAMLKYDIHPDLELKARKVRILKKNVGEGLRHWKCLPSIKTRSHEG